MTKHLPLASLLALLGAAPAAAGTLEIGVHGGRVAPSYQQTFHYGLGTVPPVVPGVEIRQQGVFTLDAQGGAALGASARLYLLPFLALEARLDQADIAVTTRDGRFDVHADLPAPIPDLDTSLNLDAGSVSVDGLRPVSLNLWLKTPGALAITLSAGVSYLPALSVVINQPLALGVTGFNEGRLQIATLALRAEAHPVDGGDGGRFGLNGGLGLRLALGSHLALGAEGRYFQFQKHRLTWRPASDRPLSPTEETLLRAALQRLDTVEFSPLFFQATLGLAVVF